MGMFVVLTMLGLTIDTVIRMIGHWYGKYEILRILIRGCAAVFALTVLLIAICIYGGVDILNRFGNIIAVSGGSSLGIMIVGIDVLRNNGLRIIG